MIDGLPTTGDALYTSLMKIFIQICHPKKPCKGALTCVVRTKKKNPFQKQNCFLHACNMDMVNNQPTPLGHISKHVQIVHHHEAFMSCIHIQNETLQELMTNFIPENQTVGFI
jgi:hypothetical protein